MCQECPWKKSRNNSSLCYPHLLFSMLTNLFTRLSCVRTFLFLLLLFSSPPSLLFLLKNNEVTRKGKKQEFLLHWYYVEMQIFSPTPNSTQKQTIILQIIRISREVRKLLNLLLEHGKSLERCSMIRTVLINQP